jgi:hypothetical protein
MVARVIHRVDDLFCLQCNELQGAVIMDGEALLLLRRPVRKPVTTSRLENERVFDRPIKRYICPEQVSVEEEVPC